MNVGPPTERQRDALVFALEHGQWVPYGRGGPSILAGLVKRGLMEKHVNPEAMRWAHDDRVIMPPLHMGVLTETGKAYALGEKALREAQAARDLGREAVRRHGETLGRLADG